MNHTRSTRRTVVLSTLLAALATVAMVASLALSPGGGASAAGPTRQPAAAAPPAAVVADPVPPARPARPVRPEQALSPQMLLTDTDEVRTARIGAWQDCLVAHGATYAADRPGPATLGVAPRPVADPVPPAAEAACRSVVPRQPVETNPRLNPDYVADSEANVACLRDHGIPVHLYQDTTVWPDGLSWTYDSSDAPLPDHQTEIERACELAAFTG
ncbi:hypothetical protein [Nocardioides dongxiaopingii]|uniref:hypothetical protein n=1 Tax=Nocardioides dongxiaopingii TaxID=2576036 RepID=UPI0010C766DE|nr:hypothetical protein [Nocardioides dongxiaopingii]